jgi:hypothetical protein
MQRPGPVGTTVRRALAALLAVAAVLAAGLALAAAWSALRSSGDDDAAAGEPIALAATITPVTHLFADELTARVVVELDRRAVDPESVRVRATFRPYGAIEPPAVTETRAGDVVRQEYRYRVYCLRADCRPRGSDRRRFVLRPVQVLFETTDGRTRGTSLRLPPVEVSTRLTAADVLRPELDVGDDPLPVVAYRVEPDRLARALGLAAALLGIVGVSLLAVEGRRALRLARERRRRPPTPVEQALGLLRRAERDGDERDRRLALDALASAVDGNDTGLASTIRDAAWAPGDPSARDLGGLADAAARTAGAEA